MPGALSSLFASSNDQSVGIDTSIDLDIALALDTSWSLETEHGSWSGGQEIALDAGLHLDLGAEFGHSGLEDLTLAAA